MKLSSFLHFAAFGVRTILLREKKPILGTVIVTDRCNLKCRHCSVHDLTSVDHPYEQIRREMELLYHMGVRILFFCGGETFLWHDGARTVRDLVVEAKEMILETDIPHIVAKGRKGGSNIAAAIVNALLYQVYREM